MPFPGGFCFRFLDNSVHAGAEASQGSSMPPASECPALIESEGWPKLMGNQVTFFHPSDKMRWIE